jgi:predicted SprT family Zn-dependent metalloprotease
MELRAAYEMAVGLVQEHGLEGWRVELDGAKRRAGVCRYAERVIGLSAPMTRVHSEDLVRDTVLHEIAHALVGSAHGHDAVWRRTAVRIGASGERCVATDAPTVIGAWIGVCAAGHVRDRHRRPERVLSCVQCSRTFSVDHLFEWTYHGRPARMHPNYEAELAALRSGARLTVQPVGTRVRVVAEGEFEGRVGKVLKHGRTSYHVRLPEGVLRVPFALAERV